MEDDLKKMEDDLKNESQPQNKMVDYLKNKEENLKKNGS